MNLPPLPESLDKRMNDFATSCVFGDHTARVNAAKQLELSIQEYAHQAQREAVAAQQREFVSSAVPSWVKEAVAAAVPEGWKLVPIEPTEEMFFDPDEVCVNFKEASWDAFLRIYRNLLTAVPEVER